MTFNSSDIVFFAIGFLVPGVVWLTILSMLVPRRTVCAESRLWELLTLSCINHGLWSWTLFSIFKTGFVDAHRCWTAIYFEV